MLTLLSVFVWVAQESISVGSTPDCITLLPLPAATAPLQPPQPLLLTTSTTTITATLLLLTTTGATAPIINVVLLNN
jgi:hypothetical protein